MLYKRLKPREVAEKGCRSKIWKSHLNIRTFAVGKEQQKGTEAFPSSI